MLNFADRTGYGAFTVLWPQMGEREWRGYMTGGEQGKGSGRRQLPRLARGAGGRPVWKDEGTGEYYTPPLPGRPIGGGLLALPRGWESGW